MNKGFTLLEVMVVVLIVGILTAVALPNYTRSIEKSRATEAMGAVKALNDAAYAYFAEKSVCPPSFSKLLVTLPGDKVSDTVQQSKYFKYTLNAATNAPIPGTNCGGVVAERLTGDKYYIWNPYSNSGGKRTLACNGSNAKAVKICKSMGIYTTVRP